MLDFVEMGPCLSAQSSQIAPSVNLIDLIQSFESDKVVMDYVNANPKSLMDADDVS